MRNYGVLTIILVITLTAGVAPPALSRSAAGPSPRPAEYRSLAAVQDKQGRLWAVWEVDDGSDSALFFSYRNEGRWTEPRPVRRRPAAWDRAPTLTVAPDGTLWLAWSSATKAEPDRSRLYISRWAGDRWATPRPVPPGDGVLAAKQPILAAAPDGTLWLAWVGFDGNDTEIYAVSGDGRTWSRPRRVSSDDTDPLAYDTHPRLAVGADGKPWLAWVSSEGLFDDVIVVSRWDGTGWSAEEVVSAPDDTPDVWPSLALDADGQPWIAWQDVVGAGAKARWRIHVANRMADGRWSDEQMVSSPPSVAVDERRPHLAFDDAGRPHLVWTVEGRLEGTAYATRMDAVWTQPVLVSRQNGDVPSRLIVAERPRVIRPGAGGPAEITLSDGLLSDSEAITPDILPAAPIQPEVQCIYNRYVAWGDSITWGGYEDPPDSGIPVGDYPGRLESKLDTRVTPSEVINRGIPGEKVSGLRKRIGDEAELYLPQFPLIMEGTNDVTHDRPPSEVAEDLAIIIDILKKHSDIKGIRPWLSTIIPRTDGWYNDTQVMNDYIRGVSVTKGVPLADNWQAFLNYGDWVSLMWDSKHPNSAGMQLLADTWYASILGYYSWLNEETEPPTAWVSSLPAQTECGVGNVTWSGQDNLTPADQLVYDVQMNINGGAWTDWMVNTTATGSGYTGDRFGDILGFRVRARDLVGNVGEWSDPLYTIITDGDPPQASMDAMPVAQLPPFRVSWSGSDTCSAVTAYNVQYKIGASGVWTDWKTATSLTSDDFDISPFHYGETYYFRVQARDEAGNWSAWSDEVQTIPARFAVRGRVGNIRGQAVVAAQVDFSPAALATDAEPAGGFVTYLAASGSYTITVGRDDRYASLLPMRAVSVTDHVDGLEFILPPQDDAVNDGDFEAGTWGRWQIGGSAPPTLTATAHTGLSAVRLGGSGENSSLSQFLTPTLPITLPTLSFMARLETPGPVGALTVRLANQSLLSPPVTYTVTFSEAEWTHVWFDMTGLVSAPLTLTFVVSDSPAVLLDEVRLGSAAVGGYAVYLPLTARGRP